MAGTLPLGQLALTTEVENYPGFPAGDLEPLPALGPRRREPLPRRHASQGRLLRPRADGADAAAGDELRHADRHRRHRRRSTSASGRSSCTRSSGQRIEAHAVIIATGARANYLGLPSEEHVQEPRRQRLCRVRRRVAAVPQQAAGRRRRRRLGRRRSDYLTKFASDGLHGPSPRRAAGAQDHGRAGARTNPKIEMAWNSDVDEVLGRRQGRRHRRAAARAPSTTATRELDATGMFVAIGHTPNTRVPRRASSRLNDKSYIKLTMPFRTNTSVEGVFAAGDVADDYYRQADHRRRQRLHGGARRRTLAGGAGHHSVSSELAGVTIASRRVSSQPALTCSHLTQEIDAMEKLSVARSSASRRRSVAQATLQGWVRTRRDSKGGFSFLELNDGSCLGERADRRRREAAELRERGQAPRAPAAA